MLIPVTMITSLRKIVWLTLLVPQCKCGKVSKRPLKLALKKRRTNCRRNNNNNNNKETLRSHA